MQVCWGRGGGGEGGEVVQLRGGVPLGMGAVDALRWTRRYASFPLARKNNERPHSTRAHLHQHALHCSLCVSCLVCVFLCCLWHCGLVSACE